MQSQRTQVQSWRGSSPETGQETQRRHPIWTLHLHCYKGNRIHNPCQESQWWENSLPRCILFPAAQNNPSKQLNSRQHQPLTSNNASGSTNSHPRHCYPTIAIWGNTNQPDPTTVQITATDQIYIRWTSEGLHHMNCELTLNIDHML